MKRAALLLLPLCCWVGAGSCRRGLPERGRPWVVVLDEAAAPDLARISRDKLAAQLSGKLEPALLDLELSGVRRHLVASPGLATEDEARKLARDLCAGKACRLALLDTSGAAPLGEGLAAATSLEGLEPFEQLASTLPGPPGADLSSLALVLSPDRSCRLENSAAGAHFGSRWCAMGFERLAEARLRLGRPAGEALVLLGAGSAKTGAELTEAVGRLLREQTAPDDEQWQARQKAARSARRGRRARKKIPPAAESVPEKIELPPIQKKALPWGEGEVFRFERIGLKPPERYKPGDPLYSVWLIPLESEAGVMLALASDEALLAEAFAPVGLGPARGLRFNLVFLKTLSLLPEGLSEGERLEQIYYLPAARLLGAAGRAAGAAQAWRMSFAGSGFFWRFSRIELAGAAEAQRLYESGFVEPRRLEIQKLLDSKRKLNYVIGLQLVEIGDVSGWLRKGAAGGRRNEIYFQKDNSVWWLEEEGMSGPEAEGNDLISRASLLPVW